MSRTIANLLNPYVRADLRADLRADRSRPVHQDGVPLRCA
jgi:hypothetical protein